MVLFSRGRVQRTTSRSDPDQPRHLPRRAERALAASAPGDTPGRRYLGTPPRCPRRDFRRWAPSGVLDRSPPLRLFRMRPLLPVRAWRSGNCPGRLRPLLESGPYRRHLLRPAPAALEQYRVGKANTGPLSGRPPTSSGDTWILGHRRPPTPSGNGSRPGQSADLDHTLCRSRCSAKRCANHPPLARSDPPGLDHSAPPPRNTSHPERSIPLGPTRETNVSRRFPRSRAHRGRRRLLHASPLRTPYRIPYSCAQCHRCDRPSASQRTPSHPTNSPAQSPIGWGDQRTIGRLHLGPI